MNGLYNSFLVFIRYEDTLFVNDLFMIFFILFHFFLHMLVLLWIKLIVLDIAIIHSHAHTIHHIILGVLFDSLYLIS